MNYKRDMSETRERFTAWWTHKPTGRPLMNLWARREKSLEMRREEAPADAAEQYLNVEKVLAPQVNRLAQWEPLAEAFPSASLNLGAGSMALYLGSQPEFRAESVWFEHCLTEYEADGTVVFDRNNAWYQRHLQMYAEGKKYLAGTDILLDIPDIVENLDVVSAMRGPQAVCFDLYDYPEEVKQAIWKINDYYKTCFDAFNEYCIDEAGGNAFTAFNIYGQGRTAKVQCDCSALVSPAQFREFVQEPLREQCRWLTNSLYHLDGPECICQLPALMEIEELNALQWTAGDGKPAAGEECWWHIYRAVKDAGKGAWVNLTDYAPQTAVAKADALVKGLAAQGFYFQFPPMERELADQLMIHADKHWKC